MKTLAAFTSLEVESYRFTNVSWPREPFEGRHMPHFDVEQTVETRVFPPGSAVVPVGQTLGRVILNLLEPHAPDSLARWGFFNAIFEEKEYAEHYVLEALAREMMANDPALEAGVQTTAREGCGVCRESVSASAVFLQTFALLGSANESLSSRANH